eukprot:g17351.t1
MECFETGVRGESHGAEPGKMVAAIAAAAAAAALGAAPLSVATACSSALFVTSESPGLVAEAADEATPFKVTVQTRQKEVHQTKLEKMRLDIELLELKLRAGEDEMKLTKEIQDRELQLLAEDFKTAIEKVLI